MQRYLLSSLSSSSRYCCNYLCLLSSINVGKKLVSKGFTLIMDWLNVKENELPDFETVKSVPITDVTLSEGQTSPPDDITEAELIGLVSNAPPKLLLILFVIIN